MRTAILVLSIMAGLLLAPLTFRLTDKLAAEKITTETLNQAYVEEALPKPEESLKSTEVKLINVKKTITLEARNTVVFRGPVTGSSVSEAMRQLRDVSRRISRDTPIYLVLDTPGGSIFDGLDLIDFAKALPQKIHTVTLFAASMGFQIAQNMETRYIVRNGQLMSHRARVSQFGGQIKGEFESRYAMLRRSVDYLDYVAAKRMEMDPKAYEKLIFNEYWVYGYDAVAEKAADEQILVRCGESMDGSEEVQYDTIFGPVTVTFSKCPLIKAPEKIDFSKIGTENLQSTQQVFKLAIEDKSRFVKEYITTDRFSEVFR